MSLADVADKGDRLATLCELRGQLARLLDVTDSGRDYAALSLRMVDVLEQIAECEKQAAPTAGGTALDEVNARRAAKVAAGKGGSAGRRVGRG